MLLLLSFDIRNTQYVCGATHEPFISNWIFIRIANSIIVRPFNAKVNQNKFSFYVETLTEKGKFFWLGLAKQNKIHICFGFFYHYAITSGIICFQILHAIFIKENPYVSNLSELNGKIAMFRIVTNQRPSLHNVFRFTPTVHTVVCCP